ncbi:MAG: SpoIIE family protein phosphatase, partial [Bacteroidales bacterium]
QIVYGRNSSDTQAKKTHYQKAIELSKEALEIAKSTKSIRQENPQYHHLHEAYSGLGDFKKAYEYAKLFIQTNDSLFSEEKTNAIAEMQTKYETTKKEQEIENQKLIIAQQETYNQKQRIIHYFLGISVSLLFLLIIFVLYAYRQKRISHDSIKKKNNLLEQANEEIKAQKDEITSQRDMVFSQKKQIENQNRKITDSINYARVIQGAVLPSTENISNILEQYFILYKPKEIVSGDFYWVSKVKNLTVFAVADCTGHGVPGAFMSMLGLSFLNEIITKKGVTRPNEILNLMRDSVIEALQQKGRFADQSEGINMSLCVWDNANNMIHFSGAKNPLIIVTKDKKLKTIQADKQPIASHKKIKPFTEQKLEFNKGDIIYLATDGFQDQFGGDEYKRFTRRRLVQLLLDVSDKPLDKQKKIINNTFENWKNKNDQVDDVTILAVKA